MSKNTEVKCPSCKEVFKVDDSVYTDIVKQVRDQQFQDELNNRLESAQKEKQSALQLKESELKIAFQQQLAEKQSAIEALKHKSKSELFDEVSKKEKQLQELKSKIDRAETEKKLALSNAVKDVEKERDQLVNDVKLKEAEKQTADLDNKIQELLNSAKSQAETISKNIVDKTAQAISSKEKNSLERIKQIEISAIQSIKNQASIELNNMITNYLSNLSDSDRNKVLEKSVSDFKSIN